MVLPLEAWPVSRWGGLVLIEDRKAKHSPTNDWDTGAVWVDARRAVTATQELDTPD